MTPRIQFFPSAVGAELTRRCPESPSGANLTHKAVEDLQRYYALLALPAIGRRFTFAQAHMVAVTLFPYQMSFRHAVGLPLYFQPQPHDSPDQATARAGVFSWVMTMTIAERLSIIDAVERLVVLLGVGSFVDPNEITATHLELVGLLIGR
jgi:hypothetical protein